MAGLAMNRPLQEVPDRWVLDFGNGIVDQCCFDYAVTLRVSSGPWELRVEQPFSVRKPNGEEHHVVPEETAHLNVVLDNLLRSHVTQAAAFKDGRLELRLDDDTVVEVPPQEDYEAWTLTGPGDLRIISLPGGDLAIWGSR